MRCLSDSLCELAEAADAYALRVVFEPLDRGVDQRGLIGPGRRIVHAVPRPRFVEDLLQPLGGRRGKGREGRDATVGQQAGDLGADAFDLRQVVRFGRCLRLSRRLGLGSRGGRCGEL